MELGQVRSSAGAAPAAVAVDLQEYQTVALSRIHESPTNPRKTFDGAKLADLAASITAVGRILQPMVVRKSPWEMGQYEIIAGARRYRAAKIAGLTAAPVRIIEMTDAEVLEAQLVENLQRDDVQPLEEAAGYRQLMSEHGHAADAIAGKVGKSKEYVYGRLKLLACVEPVRKEVAAGKMTPGHAILIARLTPKDQEKAREACFDWNGHTRSVRELDNWIEQNVRLPLDSAPFKLDDAQLVAAAGACDSCEKRDGKRCLDRGCYQTKTRALIEVKKAGLAKKGEFVLLSNGWGSKKLKGGALQRQLWAEADDKSKNPLPGLFIDGDRVGKVIQVVRKAAPRRHGRPIDWEAENRKREERRTQERAVRCAILKAALEGVKAPLERADLEAIALGVIGQGLHDDGLELIGKALGIERDWTEEVASLKPQGLARLLVALAVADELAPWRPEDKADRLLALAKRYKVKPDKIRAQVEAELRKGPAEKKLEDLGLLPKVQTAAKGGARSRLIELARGGAL